MGLGRNCDKKQSYRKRKEERRYFSARNSRRGRSPGVVARIKNDRTFPKRNFPLRFLLAINNITTSHYASDGISRLVSCLISEPIISDQALIAAPSQFPISKHARIGYENRNRRLLYTFVLC